MVGERFIKFRPCSAQSAILAKNGANVKPFCRSAENSNTFTGKHPWQMLLFSKVSSLEFIIVI